MILTNITMTGCSDSIGKVPSFVARLSVSSDGKYAVSTHYGHYLVLWDLENQKRTILSQNATIHSAYFIKNTHLFLWQDSTDNTVYLQYVSGAKHALFQPNFPVYGQIISQDKNNYIASDANWSLFHSDHGNIKIFKRDPRHYSISARLLGLSLGEKYFLTTGDAYIKGEKLPIGLGFTMRDANPKVPERVNHSLLNGVVLWDAKSHKPLKKLFGMQGKTAGTLSPDEQYVVAADEGTGMFLWETKTGKRIFSMDTPTSAHFQCGDEECEEELALLIKENRVIPDDFYEHPLASFASTVAVKFIDEQGHFIRFVEAVNYATLYHTDSPKVQAFMNFGKEPQPDVFDSADVIDTAPKAKLLVMAQSGVGVNDKSERTGIIVYRFDDKTQTLERIWAPIGPPPHKRVHNPDDKWEF